MAITKKNTTKTRAYCRFSADEKAIVQRVMKDQDVSEAEAIRRLIRMSSGASEVTLELSILKNLIEQVWQDLAVKINRLEKTVNASMTDKDDVTANLKARLRNL